MAKTTAGVSRVIGRYRAELSRMGIRVTAVLLFGSQARGTAHEGSDIDLIIVSPDFAGMGLLKRLETLGVASAHIMEPIQAYGLTPEEVERRELPPFWSDVLDHEAVPVFG